MRYLLEGNWLCLYHWTVLLSVLIMAVSGGDGGMGRQVKLSLSSQLLPQLSWHTS